MEKIIEITGLTKKYKNGRGITDINLDVFRGEIFGFLGPNGAGKTTAMKIMSGLMHADDGDIKLFGHSIKTDFPKAIKKVSCIIETAETYPYLTAYENLVQVSRYYNNENKVINEERINWAIEVVGLSKYKNERTKNFSLGMKQRIGIAAAIVSKPELIILDEPLNGLDIEGMVDMRKLFKKLAEEDGTTFFISSHLIHDVELTCNKIGIVHDGKMIAVNTTENILNDFASLENYFISEVISNGRN
jgi:ABC-2 type transport system ATP-binding protein